MNTTLPFPTPTIRPDPRLAARMMRAYNEELSQVITYTYQHLLTEGLDNEASKLFLDLATEDMAHFHSLGRLIRALEIRVLTQRSILDLQSEIRPQLRYKLQDAIRLEYLLSMTGIW